MLLTFAHTFFYAFGQTFGVMIFKLALKRLGKLENLNPVKTFFFLLLFNIAGTMTFGETSWQARTTPLLGGIFALGVLFFLSAHLYLAYRKVKDAGKK